MGCVGSTAPAAVRPKPDIVISAAKSAVPNSGRVEASGGTLTVTGGVTGTGTLQADSGATLVLNGATNTASTVVDNGVVSLGANDNLTASGTATVVGDFCFNR